MQACAFSRQAYCASLVAVGSLGIAFSVPVSGHPAEPDYSPHLPAGLARSAETVSPSFQILSRSTSAAIHRSRQRGLVDDGREIGAVAQLPDGHSEHHPGNAAGSPGGPPMSAPGGQASPPSNSAPGTSSGSQSPMPGMGSSGSGTGAGAMGGMMGGCMGGGCMGGPRKEFYASLMALPDLSPEQRQRIEAQAHSWISAGTDEIANAETALRHANAAGDNVWRRASHFAPARGIEPGEERHHDPSIACRGKAAPANRAGMVQGRDEPHAGYGCPRDHRTAGPILVSPDHDGAGDGVRGRHVDGLPCPDAAGERFGRSPDKHLAGFGPTRNCGTRTNSGDSGSTVIIFSRRNENPSRRASPCGARLDRLPPHRCSFWFASQSVSGKGNFGSQPSSARPHR